MTVNFKVNPEEQKLLAAITARYCARFPDADYTDAEMDFTACHCNGTPMNLTAFFGADDFNFLHDACGIRDHIDRTTGKLIDHFSPRFALERTT